MTKETVLGTGTRQRNEQTNKNEQTSMIERNLFRARAVRLELLSVSEHRGLLWAPCFSCTATFVIPLVLKEYSHHHKGQSGRKKKKVTLGSLCRQPLPSSHRSLKSFFFFF